MRRRKRDGTLFVALAARNSAADPHSDLGHWRSALTRGAAERLREQTYNAQLRDLAENRQPDRQSRLARLGLSAISAEQPTPPRQIEPEIAARPLARDGVMPLGHLGRPPDPAHDALEP